MKFIYILTVVACLLNAFTTVNASELAVRIDMGGNCESVFHSEDGKTYACNKGLYCLKIPYSQEPAMCTPVCDTCYVREEPGKPSSQAFCAPGYASYMTGSLPQGDVLCNICEKGWYSENPDNAGNGSYIPGSTPYPGNVGCVKCPSGYTTEGRGVGKSSTDCKFLGQLPPDWKENLQGNYAVEPASAFEDAISKIEKAQQDLLTVGQALGSLDDMAKSFMRSSMQQSADAVSLALQMQNDNKIMMKASELYDGTTGKMTCTKMQDCHEIEMITRRHELQQMTAGQEFNLALACIKDTEYSQKGVCLDRPHLQGNPIPDCLEGCPHGCAAAEATRQNITVEQYFATEPDTFGTEICSCFTACSTSACTDATQKEKVGHLWRDFCSTRDPYYVPPPPTNTSTPFTGGNNLKCGFGQYVKYKNVPNMEVCTDCPRGRFAKAKTSRNRECKRCPRGWIQPDTKQGRCNRCPSGTKANRERTACV